MICPHCGASLKYKERSYNQCSTCHKVFAFEPKKHPLQISDNYFKNAVAKLSNYNKLFFTPQQLQYAVSRKKIKSSGSIATLIIIAVISTIIAFIAFLPIGILVLLFWIVLIIVIKLFFKKNISLPQTPQEFEYTVLAEWKQVYGSYPSKLMTNRSIQENSHDLKGILLCENSEAALCLAANQTDKNLGLVIVSNPNKITELLQKHGNLPIYVLHDASIEGIEFLEKVKKHFSHQAPVKDIGLRPQSVMKSKLPKFRETGVNAGNISSLTIEEIDWLNQGFYTPWFVLRPEKLIQYVTNQVGPKAKAVGVSDPEKEARAIGFMTWAGR